MRGIVLHNFPAFDEAAEHLRASGHKVFNPAEHVRELGFDECTVEKVSPETLCAMFRWDFARIQESDAVVFLPGWEKSEGAKAERVLAFCLGLECYDYRGLESDDLPLSSQRLYFPLITWVPK
jgi:hypothetical protein